MLQEMIKNLKDAEKEVEKRENELLTYISNQTHFKVLKTRSNRNKREIGKVYEIHYTEYISQYDTILLVTKDKNPNFTIDCVEFLSQEEVNKIEENKVVCLNSYRKAKQKAA